MEENDTEKPLATATIPNDAPLTATMETVTSRAESTTESIVGTFERLKSTRPIDSTVPSIEATPQTSCRANGLVKVHIFFLTLSYY